MKSGRIAIGLLIILTLAIMFVAKTTTMPSAYAAGNANGTTTASVTVNGFVSITLQNTPINFPALDPGANNTPATANQGSPLVLRVDNATTVPVMAYLNGSVFTDGGSNSFAVSNMNLNITGNSTSINASYNTARCSYSTNPAWILNETAPLGTGHRGENLWHYITIPSAQAPAAYSSNVRVCVQQTGVLQCN